MPLILVKVVVCDVTSMTQLHAPYGATFLPRTWKRFEVVQNRVPCNRNSPVREGHGVISITHSEMRGRKINDILRVMISWVTDSPLLKGRASLQGPSIGLGPYNILLTIFVWVIYIIARQWALNGKRIWVDTKHVPVVSCSVLNYCLIFFQQLCIFFCIV